MSASSENKPPGNAGCAVVRELLNQHILGHEARDTRRGLGQGDVPAGGFDRVLLSLKAHAQLIGKRHLGDIEGRFPSDSGFEE